jgi:DNA-binding MarR family transcriptional regulator
MHRDLRRTRSPCAQILRFDEASGPGYDAPLMKATDLRAIQRYYPQIYFACHVDHVRKASTAHELSSRDSGVLSHLDQTRPTTPSALARHIGVVPSTFSAQLQRLVDLGYVARARSEGDRRRWELRLTEKGSRALAATSVLDGRRVERLLARLAPHDRARAVEGMGLLAGAALHLTRRAS